MTTPVALIPLSLLLLAILAGCTPAPETYSARSQAFTQPLEVTIVGLEQEPAEAAAFSAIEDLLFIAEVSHPWKPGPLGRTNQLLSFEAEFSANPSILPMIRQATELAQQTGGQYAPALGQLQQLWGFHNDPPQGKVPDAEAITAILDARPQMDDIHIDGIRMRSDNAAVRIDFGPFAQGYALDTARERLREHRVTRARIDNGNAVAVLGEGWSLTLPGEHNGTLPLQDGEAAITLSSEDRGFSAVQEHYHPYLDPATGYPGRGIHAVTVIDSRAARAAAVAQALLAGGEAQLAAQLQQLGPQYALVLTQDGRMVTTAAMAKRLGTVREE